ARATRDTDSYDGYVVDSSLKTITGPLQFGLSDHELLGDSIGGNCASAAEKGELMLQKDRSYPYLLAASDETIARRVDMKQSDSGKPNDPIYGLLGDGRTIARGDETGEIELRDACSGTIIRRLGVAGKIASMRSRLKDGKFVAVDRQAIYSWS